MEVSSSASFLMSEQQYSSRSTWVVRAANAVLTVGLRSSERSMAGVSSLTVAPAPFSSATMSQGTLNTWKRVEERGVEGEGREQWMWICDHQSLLGP